MPRLIFRVHAIQRMYQRRISVEDVKYVLATGEAIEEYPNDTPYPSRLVSGRCGSRFLHVVAAFNKESDEEIIVTVYEPHVGRWEGDYKGRKKR